MLLGKYVSVHSVSIKKRGRLSFEWIVLLKVSHVLLSKREAVLLFTWLLSFLSVTCISSVVSIADIFCWHQNSAAWASHRDLKAYNFLEIYQAFGDRLGLLRYPGTWIRRLPC